MLVHSVRRNKPLNPLVSYKNPIQVKLNRIFDVCKFIGDVVFILYAKSKLSSDFHVKFCNKLNILLTNISLDRLNSE